jgi:DNA repair protein RecN (Recombination protein N)
MLSELRIKNFVLIEDLRLDFSPGLNILTGETGAGKSILIDALSGVLGEKMTTDVIRTGYERAMLEGVFDISRLPEVQRIISDAGIDCDDDTLVLRRELYASGKGRCFANAAQIPIQKLKEISEYLVDIHGQNEHQNIVRTAKHREILDSFAGHASQLSQIRELHTRLGELREKMESFKIDEKEKARRIEYLTFALKEIESARISAGEEDDLKSESNLLANAEKLFTEINTSSALLRGEGGVLQNLKRVEQSVGSISQYDSRLSDILETIHEALYSLEDAAALLRDYERTIDYSPQRVNEVEERLALISSMKKKYGSTVAEVLEFAEKSTRELASFTSGEEQIEHLRAEHALTVQQAKTVALDLSERRKQAAEKLEKLVTRELSDLGMAGTAFRVSIKRELSDTGEIENDSKRYVLYPHGLDRVEFLISANEGEDLRQLARVASGGEMSRLMLALKNVLLASDIVDSLVFDEVDSGIGGKTAETVGRKLKSLARDRQVLVITHLPQIASMSDTHFTVQKERSGERTSTVVKKLVRPEKIKEIARMLAGEQITDLTIRHAEEMVENAESVAT